jgi:ADP-heptose:LPS heptosyltransferase
MNSRYKNIIIKKLKLFYFYVFDKISALSFKINYSNKLLLVRLDAIGDFIIWIDSAKEYRRLYPNRKIILCVNSVSYDLASRLPYWDEVISVNMRYFYRNIVYRWKIISMISRGKYEIAIQPTYTRNIFLGDSIIRATKAKERIGSFGDNSNISDKEKAISDRWYTRLIPANTHQLMELDRNAEFIQNLSGNKFQASIPILPRLVLLNKRLTVFGDFIIIFPGASWHGRQWPSEKFSQILALLYKKYKFKMILCGSSAEVKLCQDIGDESCADIINFAGQTSLSELIELIRGARLLIANETSAIHIAVAVGTPSVCILGGGHYGRFMPYPKSIDNCDKVYSATNKMDCYNCNWFCIQDHDSLGAVPCISRIEVNYILKLADQALFDVFNK